MKANQQVQPIINELANTVTFAIGDGGEPLVLDMNKVHASIVARAALVGMAQVRIVDAAAVSATDKEGNIRSNAERMALKRARMAALIAHYESGSDQWTIRAAGGGSAPDIGITMEAIANVVGWSMSDTAARLDRLAEKQGKERKKILAEMATDPKVADEMDKIRAERRAKMPKKVDAIALLSEIEE